MNRIEKYSILSPDLWSGGIDDVKNKNAFRSHQCVKLIDLNKVQLNDIL